MAHIFLEMQQQNTIDFGEGEGPVTFGGGPVYFLYEDACHLDIMEIIEHCKQKHEVGDCLLYIYVEADDVGTKAQQIVDGKWSVGNYDGYNIIRTALGNMLGFDPERHRFICHKCQGLLKGKEGIPLCRCISGWVRPYQKYVEV